MKSANPTTTDVTDWLVDQIKTNATSPVVSRIRGANTPAPWDDPSVWAADKLAANQAWASLVAEGKVWDLKKPLVDADAIDHIFFRSLEPGNNGQDSSVILGGHALGFDAIANIHFGFVGRAAGFDETWLVGGAGVAQELWYQQTGDERAKGACDASSFCDHPFGSWSIRFGSYLYDLYGDKLSELDAAALAAALEEYMLNNPPPEPPYAPPQ